MLHKEQHPLAGQTVTVNLAKEGPQLKNGSEYRIEDWWDRVAGKSWKFCGGNPACLMYAMRSGMSDRGIPLDDEVVYGHVGAFGHLIHVSELATSKPDGG